MSTSSTRAHPWHLVRPHLGRLGAVLGLQALGSLAGLIPLLAVIELGRLLLQPEPIDLDRVRFVVIAAALGLLARVLLSSASSGIGHLLDSDVQLSLRQALAEQLGRVPIGWLNRRRTGELATVVGDDVSSVHPVIAHTPGALVSAFLVPLASILYLVGVDWVLTLITLAPVALALALVPLMATPERLREQEEFDAGTERITSSAVEFVQGIAEVKTFGDDERVHHAFRSNVESFTRTYSRMVRGLAAPTAGMMLLLSPPVMLLVVLVGGTTRVTAEAMPRADVLPFLLLGIGLSAPVSAMLGHSLEEAQGSWRALGRINDVLEQPPLREPSAPIASIGHRVELRDVRFRYGAGTEILRGIDLVLEPGTVTALVGPSGSGKSTIAQLLPRFFDPTDGAVLIGGVDLREIGSRALAESVSFVMQDVLMLHATVAENIALAAPGASAEQVRHAARRAHIHQRILELPRGYDTVIGDRTGLSGGEMQRLSLARALLSEAPVLVLDEATAFADPLTEQAITRAVAELRGERTILLIAHRPESTVVSDVVVMLEHGRIVERGRPTDLLARNGPLTSFWHTGSVALLESRPQPAAVDGERLS